MELRNVSWHYRETFITCDLTLPVSAGMFMELVANPIPKAMADSTPRNLATSFSMSSCLSRLPEVKINRRSPLTHIKTCLRRSRDINEKEQFNCVHICAFGITVSWDDAVT